MRGGVYGHEIETPLPAKESKRARGRGASSLIIFRILSLSTFGEKKESKEGAPALRHVDAVPFPPGNNGRQWG